MAGLLPDTEPNLLQITQEWSRDIPETTTVENLDPNLPLDDNLQGEGC